MTEPTNQDDPADRPGGDRGQPVGLVDDGRVPDGADLASGRGPATRRWSATDLAVVAVVVAAGIGGALATGRPTATPAIDLILRVGFAAGLAFVTPRARPWTWLVLAGVAVAASGAHLDAAAAWLALAVALASVFTAPRRWLGAVVGAASAWSLLRLPEVGPHGVSALIVAAAVAPVLVSAYRSERRTVRRRVVRVVLAGAALVVVAIGLLGLAGFLSLNHLDRGVDEARAGISAAKAGDDAGTDQHLTASVQAFEDANAKLDSWMTWPARVVPVVAQQANALATMSGLGRDLAQLAADTTSKADYRGVTLADGRVDTAAIAALEEPLTTIDDGLAQATQRSDDVQRDWLAAPLRDQYDSLRDEIATTSDEVDLALQAVRVAPGLLGADGPRRYFVAFTTPAESRGLGGFMGNWVELTAVDGTLDIARDGRVADLYPKEGEPPRTLEAPQDYLDRYGALHPETSPGDVTFSPDFPSDAQAIASIYRQSEGGAPVDGVIAIDPYGLAAMLEITGPITVDGLAEPLTSANAVDYLLRDQYVDYDNRQERIDVLDEASRKTFDTFIHVGKLQPTRIAEVLAPAVASGRIVASSTRGDETSLIERLGLSGAFPARGGEDFFGLVTQNGGNNKIDAYLKRAIDYRASFDPTTGAVDADVTVTLHNDAPASGLPDYVIGNNESSGQPRGTNWTWFNFYSPHQLTSMTLAGKEVAVGAQREFGLNVYQAYVAVPAASTVEIVLHLTGAIDPADSYHVRWYEQALAHPDDLRISVSVEPPWYVDDPNAPAGTVPVFVAEPDVATASKRNGELVVPLVELAP